jgi:hypothetical protein
MNGPIAQIIALTCHGNAFLRGRNFESFLPVNSTCTFCDRVNFVLLKKTFWGKMTEKEIAKSPDDWFVYLKSTGATGIRLSHTQQKTDDRLTAGFVGGGGTWSMEVLYPNNKSEYWIARWEVWNQKAPQNRIWSVSYGRVSICETPKLNPTDIGIVAEELKKSLLDIRSFSEIHKCSSFFTECFTKALDTINSKGKNLYGYHKDLAPKDFLPEIATMILYACQDAYLFGGMGTWNDMGFNGDDQKEYERVSDGLFNAVNTGIIAAANTSSYNIPRDTLSSG